MPEPGGWRAEDVSVFEFDNTANIWAAQALRNAADAGREMRAGNRARAELARAVEIARYNGIVAEAVGAERDRLLAEVASLRQKLAVEEAHALGAETQVRRLIAAHPDSPELASSGQRCDDGRMKSVCRIAYEKAFDAHCRKAGLNPLDFRNN